jgi:hypothetical protein
LGGFNFPFANVQSTGTVSYGTGSARRTVLPGATIRPA